MQRINLMKKIKTIFIKNWNIRLVTEEINADCD